MDLNDVKIVEQEIKRLQTRINKLKERAREDEYTFFGCKESGAVKRAALDLKMELTRITS